MTPSCASSPTPAPAPRTRPWRRRSPQPGSGSARRRRRKPEARTALEDADPELAQLQLQRAEKVERSIRSDIETLTREKRDLEVALTELGREGVGEQLAEVEGQLALKTKQRAAKDLEASAARLLHDTLAQAQRRIERPLARPGAGAREALSEEVASGQRDRAERGDARDRGLRPRRRQRALRGLERGGARAGRGDHAARPRRPPAGVEPALGRDPRRRPRQHGRGPARTDAPCPAGGGQEPPDPDPDLPRARLLRTSGRRSSGSGELVRECGRTGSGAGTSAPRARRPGRRVGRPCWR